jgi:formylglycine-generating enzyme required for sulfatase activity
MTKTCGGTATSAPTMLRHAPMGIALVAMLLGACGGVSAAARESESSQRDAGRAAGASPAAVTRLASSAQPLAAQRGCPASGGPMVRVPAGGGSYCIDVTEVSQASYAKFLASAPGADPGAPQWCGPVLARGPTVASADGPGCPAVLLDAAKLGDMPMPCVRWCDARAFCAWAGKRLCGAVGGGSTPPALSTDAASDEWFSACTAGGKSSLPYGPAFQEGRCVEDGGAQPTTRDTGCRGIGAPFSEVSDLAGNVLEWTDACEEGVGGPFCLARGGSYLAPGGKSACETSVLTAGSRPDIGFRCCAD